MIKIPILTNQVIAAVADHLKSLVPKGIHFYNTPKTQETELPAIFINMIPLSGIVKETGGRYRRKYTLNIIYMEQYNDDPKLFPRCHDIFDIFEEHLELIPYRFYVTDGEGNQQLSSVLIRTYQPEATLTSESLNYRVRLDLHVRRDPGDAIYMEVLDLNEYLVEPEWPPRNGG